MTAATIIVNSSPIPPRCFCTPVRPRRPHPQPPRCATRLMYLVAFAQFFFSRPGGVVSGRPAGWFVNAARRPPVLRRSRGHRRRAAGAGAVHEPGYYLASQHGIAAVWKSGMSFHGGFLGVWRRWPCGPKTGKPWLAGHRFHRPPRPPRPRRPDGRQFHQRRTVGPRRRPALPWAM